jgi:hypothetical protein
VREFDYKRNFFSKLSLRNVSGGVVWIIQKPRFYSQIIAVDVDHAAVLFQAGREADGNRVDQVVNCFDDYFKEKLEPILTARWQHWCQFFMMRKFEKNGHYSPTILSLSLLFGQLPW